MRSAGWLVVMAMACGGSAAVVSAAQAAGAATGHAGKAGAFDACVFLTRDEIAAALGRNDLAAGKRKDGGTECWYSSATGSVTVWTIASMTPQSFREFRDLLKEQRQNIEAAPGIGDDAYFWGDRIYVRVGMRGFTLELHQNTLNREPPAKVRPVLLTLARSGAAKLR